LFFDVFAVVDVDGFFLWWTTVAIEEAEGAFCSLVIVAKARKLTSHAQQTLYRGYDELAAST